MLFYSTFFIYSSLLALCVHGKPTLTSRKEPERCCIPKQFSAQISTSSGVKLPDGTIAGTYGYYNFSYDALRGRVGMRGVSFSIPYQMASNLWIIENNEDGQVYTIEQESRQCFKSTLPVKPMSCIPDSATYLHSFNYGYGNKTIAGNTWLVKIDNEINYATVSADGLCIPLSGHVFLTDPAVVTAITTTDFQPEIPDPTIFDIPPQCQNLL